MTFTLPFTEPVAALIDVRNGGDAAAVRLGENARRASGNAPLGLAIYRGVRDDKVLTYAQWPGVAEAESWLSANPGMFAPIDDAARWSARLYRLDSSANRSPLDLASDGATIAHTGLFAMLEEGSLDEFLRRAKEAAQIAIENTPALITANFHASLDRMRAVNLGFWTEEEAFWELARNPPFQNRYWEGLADNEPGFYRRVWVMG